MITKEENPSVGTRVFDRGSTIVPFGRFPGRKGTIISLNSESGVADVEWDEIPDVSHQVRHSTVPFSELEIQYPIAPVLSHDDLAQLITRIGSSK